MEEPQRYHLGTFLVVQWIKLCLLLKGLQVQFLVKELRPRVPLSQKKKQNINQKQYCNKFINTFLKVVCCLIAGPYLTLLRPHGLYSPPGSSVHVIFQATTLEWVAISYSRGSSQHRDRTHISCIGRWILYH